MIDPNQDKLSHFAHWYLTSGEVDKVYTPMKNGLVFIEGVSGIVLYRVKYSDHLSVVNGGNEPINNSQVVIDSPESVSLVRPPTRIISIIINNKTIIHIFN